MSQLNALSLKSLANFSIFLFVIRVNLLHPCSFAVYYYIFGVFPPLSVKHYQFSGFLQFKGQFVDGQNTSK